MSQRSFLTILLCICSLGAFAEKNPPAVSQLLDRIGGKGASSLILTEQVEDNAGEWFEISTQQGKPCIKGSSVSAITTGINWYLNHYAHINLTWNNLTTKLSKSKLPLPQQTERRSTKTCYRYYLNYCTFSYSMATWTWERWQQEIDWMALHGINMPLQIIGLDVVWKNLLEQDYGYTRDEVNDFVAGPAFQAWWGMNNLEGWGGPNPDWWYKRQTELTGKILQRERELGMQPVLPGFSGMAPSNFQNKTKLQCLYQGGWCGYVRPLILDPNENSYAQVAERYYKHLEALMGKSLYYSMDPFHEGGRLASGRYSEGYKAVFDAMENCCGPQSKWVIQQWQWADYQATSLTAVPAHRLVVLDLFSDGQPAFDRFNGYGQQDAIYCAIPNFGGRTGFFGRIPRMARDYFRFTSHYASIKGVGAAPEAIEQTPVVYDFLFELPWMNKEPNTKEWMANYAKSRYGEKNAHAEKAWELLRTSALNNTNSLQGPHEAVMCARPALDVSAVSTWGGTDIFYDSWKVVEAVDELLAAGINTKNANYSYDLCDLVRQVMSDYSKALLEGIQTAHEAHDTQLLRRRCKTFLELILDVDKLLGTNQNFRLGNWTEKARAIADEAEGTTLADRDWLELQNARTLISTWGDQGPADGGLRDYSYRQWQGMLRDYYYPRWQHYFSYILADKTTPDKASVREPNGSWFFGEWEWAHNLTVDFTKAEKLTEMQKRSYSAKPEGSTVKEAKRLMKKYIIRKADASGTTIYSYLDL